jgi:tetratricopeptide (TPR) repeat protein
VSEPQVPTGTVTLLFTDVEGSTRLLQSMGEQAFGELTRTDRWVLSHLWQASERAHVGRGDLAGARRVNDQRLADARRRSLQSSEVLEPFADAIRLAELVGDLDAAIATCAEAIELISSEPGTAERPFDRATMERFEAIRARLQGRLADAIGLQRRGLEIIREAGYKRTETLYLVWLGRLHLMAGDLAEARGRFREAIDVAEGRVLAQTSAAHVELAETERRLGRLDEARTHLRSALEGETVWASFVTVSIVETAARIAVDEDRPEVAARLLAAADAARERMRLPVPALEVDDRHALVARVREADHGGAMRSAGAALTLDDARREAADYVGV